MKTIGRYYGPEQENGKLLVTCWCGKCVDLLPVGRSGIRETFSCGKQNCQPERKA